MGFTPVESEVYLYLLTTSPTSGYKIAKETGRPAPQVYRALDGLAQKGAILMAEGKTRLCRAVPVDTCLRNLERGFAHKKERAAEVLRDLPTPADDERVYRLESRDQVFERCREMLRDASRCVLLDLFPSPLQELRPDVEALVSRRIPTALKSYGKQSMDGIAHHVVPDDATRLIDQWPGNQINIVVDAGKFLWAMLSKDNESVLYAFWSANHYLGAMAHNGLISELSLTRLRQGIARDADSEELSAIMLESDPFFLSQNPAIATLLSQQMEKDS